MRKCRKMISVIMLMVMLVSLLPSGALAAEAPTGEMTETTAVEEPQGDMDVEAVEEPGNEDSQDSSDASGGEAAVPEDPSEGASDSDVSQEPGEITEDIQEEAGGAATTSEVAAEAEPSEDAGLGETSVEAAPVEEPVEKAAAMAAAKDLKKYTQSIGGTFSIALYKNGEPLPKNSQGGYTLVDGNTYRLVVSLSSHTPYEEGTYTFSLPSEFTYKVDTGNITDKDNNKIGEFSIVNKNVLQVVFNELSPLTQDVALNIAFDLTAHGDDGDTTFLDTIPIKIEGEDQKVELEKKWVKTASSTTGTGENPTVTDRFTWEIKVTTGRNRSAVGYRVVDRVSTNTTIRDEDKAAGVKVTAKNGSTSVTWTVNEGSAGFSWNGTSGWEYTIPAVVPSGSGKGTALGTGWDFVFSCTSTGTIDWRKQGAGSASTFVNRVTLYNNGSTQLAATSASKQYYIVIPKDDTVAKSGSWSGENGQREYMNWVLTFGLKNWDPQDTIWITDYLFGGFFGASGERKDIPDFEDVTATLTFTADGASKTETLPVRYYYDTEGDVSESGYYLVYRNASDPNSTSSAGGKGYTRNAWFIVYNANYGRVAGIDGDATLVIKYKQKMTTAYAETTVGNIQDDYFKYNNGRVYNHAVIKKNGQAGNDVTVGLDYSPMEKTRVDEPVTGNQYRVGFRVDFVPTDEQVSTYDYFTLEDSMSETLSFVRDSLEVQITENDGSSKKLSYGTDYTWEYADHKLVIKLLKTGLYRYKISYDAAVAVDASTDAQPIPYENEAVVDVNGVKKNIGKYSGTLSEYNSFGTGYQVVVNKVDEKNAPLSGAVIAIYTEEGALFKSETSGADGKVTFKTDTRKDIVYTQNVPYYVQELEAPEEYGKDETKYWFVFSDPNFETDKYKTDDEWADYFSKKGITDYVISHNNTNKVEFTIINRPDSTEIPVEKVWNDNKSQHDSVTVKLFAGETDTGKTLELKEENSFKGKFTDLAKTDVSGKTIVYTVKEVTVAGYKSVVTGSAAEGFKITNTYDATGKTTLDGSKTIENRNFKAGDKWTFKVTAVTEGAPMPANTTVTINPTSGSSTDFTFGDINFKLADMGGAKEKTFEYKIEESGTAAGVQNDSKKHTVSVKVTDDGKGNLKAVKTYTDGDKTNNQKAEFVNVYKPGDVTYPLKGVKTIENRNFQEGDKWTFTVTAAAGTPMPAKTEVVIEPTSGTTADIDFGTITYSQAHAGKTYTYTVTETGTIAGVTNDPKNVKTVKIKVEDDGQGNLTATPTEDSQKVEYTNTYNATGKTTLDGSKTIENRNFKAGDKWTFKVTAVTKGAPMPAKTTVEINPTSGNSADFTFGDISLKLADMGGEKEKTFEYKIEESGTVAGVKNDSKEHTVSIRVTDDGKGHLTATKTYKDGTVTNNQKAEFVNTYGADGTYQLKGFKTLTGRNFQAGDAWTFTVTAAAGTPMPAKTEVVIEPTTGTSADIDFGIIKYGLADVGKTYTYTVTETGTIAGVANDPKNVKTVKVKVEDNGQGSLTATPTEDSQKVEYTNTYNATGKTTLDGSKTIENRNFKTGDKWTFTLSAVTANAPMPAKTTVEINPTSGNSADFTFGEISYKLSDMGGEKVKTFEYKIEESGTIAGVSNDGGAHTVSVKVTDDGKGNLKAVNTYTDGETKNNEKSNFVNVYSAEGEYALKGTKTIEGRNFQAGDKWTFKVDAVTEGAPMPAKTEVVIEPASGTTADIDFGKIKYSLANAGKTYTYTVTESGTVKGVTNDPKNVKTVIVEVMDDGQGGLTATATEKSENVAFTNTYDAKGSIDLTGKKKLENRSFKEGDNWIFTIEAKDGAPLPAVTTVEVKPEAGKTEEEVSLGTINYVLSDLDTQDTKTFEYTVTETGTVSGVVNDIKNTRTVKVKVTDKKDGSLEAVLADDSEEVTFTNTHISFSKQDVDGKEIAGAKIQILDESGTPVDSWTSEKDKSHEVKGLEAGKKYTMHEVSAPDGFTVTTDITFKVDEDHKVKVIGQSTDGDTIVKDGKVIMTDKKTKVIFSKQDVDGTEIAGAKIQILDEKGKPVDSWTSVEGESHELEGLVTGKKYTMHEVSAPDGFTVTTDIIFTIDTDGTVKVIDQSTDGETIVEDGKIIMTDKKTKVTFSKQDVGGTEIGGAEIQILDEEGTPVDSWTSVEGESHELEGLVTGKKYTMHEVNAPETFVVATDIVFTIDTDGTVKVIDQTTDGDTIVEDGKVIMTDEKTTVQISKVDTESGAELEGAKLQIIDEEGEVVEEWTSTKEVHVVRGLVANKKYILREQVAPLGYTLTTDTTFSVDAHNVVTSTGPVNKDGVILVNDTMTEVEILKVDSKTGKGLAGAKLQVLDDNGAVCDEWKSTKDAHKIRGLYTGVKYTLHEVEAPKGYDKAKDITFTIDTAGKVSSDALDNGKIVMKDTPTPKKNKTGDEANGSLWALLLMMASGALGGTVWFKRKRRV